MRRNRLSLAIAAALQYRRLSPAYQAERAFGAWLVWYRLDAVRLAHAAGTRHADHR